MALPKAYGISRGWPLAPGQIKAAPLPRYTFTPIPTPSDAATSFVSGTVQEA